MLNNLETTKADKSGNLFVPVTDDLLYEHPEQIEGPLIPYKCEMECYHWLTLEINPDEDDARTLANSAVKQFAAA